MITDVFGAFSVPVFLILGVFLFASAISAAASKQKPKSQKGSSLEKCTVSINSLMSREQAKAFQILEAFAQQRGFRIHAEVSLAAIFKVSAPGQKNAAFAGFATFRQKRVDLLITDSAHKPVCGVEYHGSGHWNGSAKKRDAAKRLAFSKAGLPLVEVTASDDLAKLPALVSDAIDSANPATSSKRHKASRWSKNAA